MARASAPPEDVDWAKSFDDGTARISRSLFLLLVAGFARVSQQVVGFRRDALCVEVRWSAACIASSTVWAILLVGLVTALAFFLVQVWLSVSCYRDAAAHLSQQRGWPVSPGFAREAVTILLAFAGIPALFGLALVADSTIGAAMLHAVENPSPLLE